MSKAIDPETGKFAPTCATCKHWQRVRDPNNITLAVGVCRAHPPQIVAMNNGQAIMAQPQTPPDCFCGMHAPALVTTNYGGIET